MGWTGKKKDVKLSFSKALVVRAWDDAVNNRIAL